MYTNNMRVHYKHVLLNLCVRMYLLDMENAQGDHNNDTARFACHNVMNMCILNRTGTVMVAFV